MSNRLRYQDWPEARKKAQCKYARAYRATHLKQMRENERKYRAAHSEQMRERFRLYRATYPERVRFTRTGVTAVEYARLVEARAGKCAICENPPDASGLCIDHSHKTGKVRDLLCKDCNLMLGRSYDNPEVLRRAASYLERHDGAAADVM